MRAVSTLFLFLFASTWLFAQAPLPPTISSVVITNPSAGADEPYRTSNETIPLVFTSDAANGVFSAVSRGGDIPFGMVLPAGGGGTVGVGFTREGLHQVQVVVSSLVIGPGPGTSVSSASAPVPVVFDRTPPSLQITRIQVNEQEGLVPYDPSKVYHTNSDHVVIQGVARDQFTPADQIEIHAKGVPGEQSTGVESNGSFEFSIDIGSLPDGSIDLSVYALEKMSDGSLSPSAAFIPVRIGR